MFYNRRFFSIRTRHHLCRQALTLLQAASSPFPTPGARARALYREGGTRSEAWREGANGNRDGDGDGAKTVTRTGEGAQGWDGNTDGDGSGNGNKGRSGDGRGDMSTNGNGKMIKEGLYPR